MKLGRRLFIALSLILILFGCGGLRYSQVDPDAANFHPRRLGVLPAEVGPYEEARGTVDRMIAEVLLEKAWFNDVVAGEAISRQLQENAELRQVIMDYMAKLRAVNFSDPGLSARIGELCQVDTFLIVSVDDWDYIANGDKFGKVGLGIKMVDAATGKIFWKAGDSKAEKYHLFKPDLLNVARSLFKKMLGYMPH